MLNLSPTKLFDLLQKLVEKKVSFDTTADREPKTDEPLT